LCHVRDLLAGVALFHRWHHDAVAALGYAWSARERTFVASLDAARGRATVAALRVTVVTSFVAFDGAVATLDHWANARRTGRATATVGDNLTVTGTPVAVVRIAVVADLAEGLAYEPVAATGDGFTRRAWLRANPTRLELAFAAAAVAGGRIAVIAVFARFDALIAADRNAFTRLPGDALECGILHCASRVAAVVFDRVFVVANLTSTDTPVTADNFPFARARWRTIPVRLDFTRAVASITGNRVSVIALFDTCLIVNPVAAALGVHGLAIRARAVAGTRRTTGGCWWHVPTTASGLSNGAVSAVCDNRDRRKPPGVRATTDEYRWCDGQTK
jgi:hypothetical protein